jgi:hypothetical protein
MFGKPRQHARSQLFLIVEGKGHVWPPITRKRTVRSRGPLDPPSKTEQSRQDPPRLGCRPTAHMLMLRCWRERDRGPLGGTLSLFELFRQNTERERLRMGARFFNRLAVGEYAGKLHDLGEPAAICLLLFLKCQLHRVFPPCLTNHD